MNTSFALIPLIVMAVSGLSFVAFFISPLIAWRKGYAPYFWLFACGPIGLVVIAILPSTRRAATPEELEQMQARANTTGAILTGVAFFVSLMLVIPAVLIGMWM
jgi:hypothetical protein